MILFGWLLCSVKCYICVLITYSPLRQFVNMCASSLEYSPLSILRIACIAINFALKMFCRPGSLTASSIIFGLIIYTISCFFSCSTVINLL